PYDGFEDYESLINDYESAFVKHANISKITTDLKKMQDNLLSVAPFPVLDKFKWYLKVKTMVIFRIIRKLIVYGTGRKEGTKLYDGYVQLNG
ncbi:hypothetical protein, partial [Klebsiella pneumoniae]